MPEKQLTEEQLLEYDGSDRKKSMYLSIKGTIFDVTKAPQFYGPDGGFKIKHVDSADINQIPVYACIELTDSHPAYCCAIGTSLPTWAC